ncbi:MFS transporter [Pseudonocardia abyssalis]|uniref:MFS transporter n=1 Tax=Pseudonocardia abyssalis TaxID=2792008 RepID=A0ABS6UQQ4_9PSEU|nr:MFS transporter [Pseudonocardia abyssalis]MBW0119512.1 MFS transporter [Pseudonocardia abyssalis]MBW0134261.1 MFS transporter [Pseudonocardia abyssalis]
MSDVLARLRAPTTSVAAVFALDGLLFGSWAARIPDVTDRVGATHATLGVALLCLSFGALAGMQPAGALCARFGAGRVTTAAAALASLAVALPGAATSVPVLGAALVVFGAATGLLNVSVNSAGVQVEARAGRPLLPALHAAFSIGGLAGAAVGGLVSSSIGVAAHLVGVGVVGLAVVAGTSCDLGRLADTAPDGGGADGRPVGRTRGIVVLLGVIAGCTAFGEGALTDWGALHLAETLGASAGLAAAGYAGFSLAMATGRLAGGRLLSRFGETRLLGGGALLAAAGMALALLTPSAPLALAGFVLVGLGFANLFPVTIARAGALGGSGGVALASTVGYSGLLGGPPVIGFLAEHSGLPVALATVPVLAVVAAALTLVVAMERPRIAVRATLARLATAAARDVDGPSLQIPSLQIPSLRILSRGFAATTRPAALRGSAVPRRHGDDLRTLTGDSGPALRPHPGLEALAA